MATTKRTRKVAQPAAPVGPPTFEVDENTLVFAFRYALGRQSTAPWHMATQLTRHWPRIATWSQAQIQREIAAAIARGDAGRDCDVETWRKVLALPTPIPVLVHAYRCEGCGQRQALCLCSHDDDDGCGAGGGNSHS